MDGQKETPVELAALELEERRLRVEDLRHTIAQRNAKRDEILRAHVIRQEELAFERARIAQEQAACTHHVGGRGIFSGDDQKYSVSKNTYPWGVTAVMCTRCHKEWWPPLELLKKANPARYKLLLKEYKEALAFPMDGEPSGSIMFQITGRQATPSAQQQRDAQPEAEAS
jgi:hypothetical protein